MICPAGNACFWPFTPVALKIWVDQQYTLSSFYKSEADVYAVLPHVFYPLPVDFTLVRGNINTMNFVVGRDTDIKAFVSTVIWITADVPYPAPGRSDVFYDIAIVKRRKQQQEQPGQCNFPFY